MNWAYAGASVCPSCKRMVRHKPRGGPHRWHGCRLRWIARRVARARSGGWDEGYKFALDNVSDPMVYADLTEYGTGWAGLVTQGGITINANQHRRQPGGRSMTNEQALRKIAEDERAGRLIAGESADRFRDVLSECLGHPDENPGDDVLVAEIRAHFGRSGPEPRRWRDFCSGALAVIDQINAMPDPAALAGPNPRGGQDGGGE